jgi:hypothetical protein
VARYNWTKPLTLSAKFRGLEVSLRLFDDAGFEFDWVKGLIKAHLPDGSMIEFAVASTLGRSSAFSDYGIISFSLAELVASSPVSRETGPFHSLGTVRLPDGTTVSVGGLHDEGGTGWDAGGAAREAGDLGDGSLPDERLDGRDAFVFWENADTITPSGIEGVADVRFQDGTTHKVENSRGLRAECAFGLLLLPLDRRAIARVELTGPRKSFEPRHRVVMADGTEALGSVSTIELPSWNRWSTLPNHPFGVDDWVRFREFDVPLGIWLTDVVNTMDITVSDARLIVHGLGIAMPSNEATSGAYAYLRFTSPSARLKLPLADVRSVRRVAPPVPGKERVSLTLRNGGTSELACDAVKYVSYYFLGEGLREGDPYNANLFLGERLWTVLDRISVRTAELDTWRQLENVRALRLSGEYPSLDVEVTSEDKATVLAGKLVLQDARVGFWFEEPGSAGRANLFVPAGTIAKIEIRRMPSQPDKSASTDISNAGHNRRVWLIVLAGLFVLGLCFLVAKGIRKPWRS